MGAQHGVLAKPETLPHWPRAPSCLCCPKLPVNSWHFQPLVIQTRNIAEPNLLGPDFLTPWLAAFCLGLGDGVVRTVSASWRNKAIFPRREPRNVWHRCPQPRDGPGAAATEAPHKASSRGTGLFVEAYWPSHPTGAGACVSGFFLPRPRARLGWNVHKRSPLFGQEM